MQQDMVSVILTAEMGEQTSVEGLTDAARRASEKLAVLLSGLVTIAGSQALFARALYLTRTEYPFLAGVRVGTAPEASLAGLDASLAGTDFQRAREGISAFFASLIGLIDTFLGEALTRRLLDQVWPEQAFDRTDSDQREA